MGVHGLPLRCSWHRRGFYLSCNDMKPQYGGLMRPELLTELNTVVQEANTPDWDGYDAHPVTEANVKRAKAFIEAMPYTWPTPLLGADPDGIAFDWMPENKTRMSISIGDSKTNKVSYAWLDGDKSGCGTFVFEDRIPETFCVLFNKLLRLR